MDPMPQATATTPLLLIVGPTASGKSDLALGLAVRLGGQIISADSMQVYRGLDIGTAKPPESAQRLVPHHLIDIAEPGQDFSMGEFVRLARGAVEAISAQGQLPIVVGGTGLYVRALLRGIFEAPGRDERLRRRLRGIAQRRGLEALHRMLARVDPDTASRLPSSDPQRIVRALEVYVLTRRPLSAHFREGGFGPELYRNVKLGIDLPRGVLYQRIDERVGRFAREGLIEEVRRLLGSGCPVEANAFKALGYREALEVLEGRLSEGEALELIRRNTRRYAKRQLTWFRREPGVNWLDGTLPPAELLDEGERVARPMLARLG